MKFTMMSYRISQPEVSNINDLWYHTSMISEHKSHTIHYGVVWQQAGHVSRYSAQVSWTQSICWCILLWCLWFMSLVYWMLWHQWTPLPSPPMGNRKRQCLSDNKIIWGWFVLWWNLLNLKTSPQTCLVLSEFKIYCFFVFVFSDHLMM